MSRRIAKNAWKPNPKDARININGMIENAKNVGQKSESNSFNPYNRNNPVPVTLVII
jgi:hypothetical protein